MLVFCHFPPTHASDLACASKASLKRFWRAVWNDLRLFSRRHGRHQLFHAKDVERPAQIVGKRRQAELGAHLLEATHEEGPLVHPLLDRAEGMLDDLATPAENLRYRLQSLCHAIERVLVFEARDGANIL